MMTLNRAPTAAELVGLGSLIEFVVALAKNPNAFDGVIEPIKAQLDEIAQTRKMLNDEQVALNVQRQEMQSEIAALNEARLAEAEKRRSASERVEQAKAALLQLDALRVEVSAQEKALAAREAAFAQAERAAAAERARAQADIDNQRAAQAGISARLAQEVQAAEAARTEYEQKLAALKAAVGG